MLSKAKSRFELVPPGCLFVCNWFAQVVVKVLGSGLANDGH
jgi:hypothetical protein